MFNGLKVTIGGIRYAVTLPGYDFREDVTQGVGDIKIMNGNNLEDFFGFISERDCAIPTLFPLGVDEPERYLVATYADGVLWRTQQSFSEAPHDFLPLFVPVNEHDEYAPELLDGIKDSEPFPFCAVFFVDSANEKHVQPMTLTRLSRFALPQGRQVRNVNLLFEDIPAGLKPKYQVEVIKRDGVLVPTRPVASHVSYLFLLENGMLQRDLKPCTSTVAWIDGLPWRVAAPRAFVRNERSEQCSLYHADVVLHKAAKLGENGKFHLLCRDISRSYDGSLTHPDRVEAWVPCSSSPRAVGSFSFGENIFADAAFYPEFMPLDPETLRPDVGVLDGVEQGETFELGTLYVDGHPQCAQPKVLDDIPKFKSGMQLKFGDLDFEPGNRIVVARVGNGVIAVDPVLNGLSWWNALEYGFIPDKE